jgi:hypothetical protein
MEERATVWWISRSNALSAEGVEIGSRHRGESVGAGSRRVWTPMLAGGWDSPVRFGGGGGALALSMRRSDGAGDERPKPLSRPPSPVP